MINHIDTISRSNTSPHTLLCGFKATDPTEVGGYSDRSTHVAAHP